MPKEDIKDTRRIAGLKESLKEERSKLLTILNEKDKLIRDEKPKLIYQYELIFGELEDELNLKNKISLVYEEQTKELIVKLKRGETVNIGTIELINQSIKKEIDKINNDSKEKDYSFFEDKYKDIIRSSSDGTDTELRSIFRELVKILHPDSSKSRMFESHWDSVLEAYKSKDLNRLKVYSSIMSKKDETQIHESGIDWLEKEIQQTRRCIDYEKRKMGRIIKQEPFSFLNLIKDKTWQKEREELILSKIREAEKLIKMIQRILKELYEGNNTSIENDDDKQFKQDFMDNTYFKY